ncbi:MAG: hypothetical protein QOJ70_532 [Acidobacteriota bacterium]|jgi:hypothetical protein|nr:hypothetical protein [Acidobacteriota bacterium]
MIDSKYYKYLAQFFSTSVLAAIGNGRSSANMNYVLSESNYINFIERGLTFRQLFENLYALLLNHYRCEYVYKNAIANMILLDRHSPVDSTLLTEFRVGTSKADVVILNGTSSVYEIKTELDSLDRLNDQIASYLKAFDNIYVVTHESQLKKIQRNLSEEIGVILLTQEYTLETLREAPPNKHKVEAATLFDCLRQVEYCDVIRDEFGFVPDVPNTRIYAECKPLFSTLDPTTAHDHMVRVLKRRSANLALRQLVGHAPHSLKFLCLISKLTSKQCSNLSSALDTEVAGS